MQKNSIKHFQTTEQIMFNWRGTKRSGWITESKKRKADL